MTEPAHLELFFAIVLGIVLVPGMDMAFVLSSSLSGGTRAGLSAVGGLIAGGAFHVLIGVTGIAALLAVVPAAFNALLIVGSAYVAWIGVSLVRDPGGFQPTPESRARSLRATFGRAMATNLLNPKAYIFMLAIFPQFLRPADGALVLQALTLGGIIAATQGTVYGALAVAGGGARTWLETQPTRLALVTRTIGALLIGAALLGAMEGWRGR